MEYKSRLDALMSFAEREHIPLVVDGDYGLRSFIQIVTENPEKRCRNCYRMRLEAAAVYAKKNGYDAYATTLFISPYQNHELMRSIGEDMADKYNVPFRYWDFRPNYRSGQEKIRSMQLYMQKYCGCIYSEEERYEKRREKIKQGFYPNFSVKAPR